jgi:hypothetical protein
VARQERYGRTCGSGEMLEKRATRRRKLDKYKYEPCAAPACGVAARAPAMIGLCGAANEAYDEPPELNKPA